MSKIGVCIETFFSDLSYKERIQKIHSIGFTNYEFWFHNKRFDGRQLIDESKDLNMIEELNDKYGLITTDFVFNHPDGGIVGSLIDKNDRNLLIDSLGEVISIAKKLNCKKLISGSGNKISALPNEEALDNMIEILIAVSKICEKDDITILLEPFNTKVDHPDYFLDDPFTCLKVLKAVNHKNARMLFDIYHMQIMSGNITGFIKENIEYIGHFHVAGVPGRHEPGNSELNYPFILSEIYKLGYKGYIGLEYWPSMDHTESLKQTKELLERV